MDKYKIISIGGTAEVIEKKSRFIAAVYPIASEEEATECINEIKKKYKDARHNCFAYVIGQNNNIQKASDDGEPTGTAGRPILDVILGEQIHNVLIIVTRYFGGTLLGTGGLIRAYSKSAQEGIKNSTVVEKQLAVKYYINTDYNGIGKINYIVSQMEINILHTEYTDIVTIEILVLDNQTDSFCKKVTEATDGRAIIKRGEQGYFIFYNQ